jgi:hypothetical protein
VTYRQKGTKSFYRTGNPGKCMNQHPEGNPTFEYTGETNLQCWFLGFGENKSSGIPCAILAAQWELGYSFNGDGGTALINWYSGDLNRLSVTDSPPRPGGSTSTCFEPKTPAQCCISGDSWHPPPLTRDVYVS